MRLKDLQIIETDVLVIGTEGTGARAAIAASEQGVNVLAITKGFVARSGATLTADGEIDLDSKSAKKMFGVNGAEEDSPEQFAIDMIVEGDYLANQKLVAIHTQEAAPRIKELIDWGARLEGFIHAPGHSYPRGLWIPGLKIARLLARRMSQSGVKVMENTLAVELIISPDALVGVLAFHIPNGQFMIIKCSAAILATGGAMRMFPRTTGPEELTGDGLAMALRAGVHLQDMEFPMFLPYTFIKPEALNGVIFSYDVSALLEVHALNRFGQRYMQNWDTKRMERSTRDINSVAAAVEILNKRGSKHGGTYLSLKHLPKNLVDFSSEWFPENMRGWKASGFNLQKFFPQLGEEAWEVAPACHFWNGGICIDENCLTNLPGLFAAGEGTAGIHGANRLAGNALTMTQVWGRRAGIAAAEYAKCNPRTQELDTGRIINVVEKFDCIRFNSSGIAVFEIRQQIRRIAGELVGIVREQDRLIKALEEITSLREKLPEQFIRCKDSSFNREWIESFQNENQLDVLEMVVRTSLTRQESRGAMYRVDFPETNDHDWLVNLIVTRKASDWNLVKQPVKSEYVSLPAGQRKYGTKEV